jgi:hypothetical protein
MSPHRDIEKMTAMKKILSILFFLVILAAAKAQDFPATSQKWENTHSLMEHKAASGKQSPKEAARLRAEYKNVRKVEKRMKTAARIATRENGKLFLRPDARKHAHHAMKRNAFSHPGRS